MLFKFFKKNEFMSSLFCQVLKRTVCLEAHLLCPHCGVFLVEQFPQASWGISNSYCICKYCQKMSHWNKCGFRKTTWFVIKCAPMLQKQPPEVPWRTYKLFLDPKCSKWNWTWCICQYSFWILYYCRALLWLVDLTGVIKLLLITGIDSNHAAR